MPHLSFADLIDRRIPLGSSEAAALTLAVARVMDVRRAAGQSVRLPDDEWILLNSEGEVSMVEVYGSTDNDETACLPALLNRLLQLEYNHLPAIRPEVFRAALERSVLSEPAALAAVFWRAASTRPERHVPRSSPHRPVSAWSGTDRRQGGMSRTDLRRALREVERELFDVRSGLQSIRPTDLRSPRRLHRAAAASLVAASFTAILAVAGLALVGAGTSPDASSAAMTLTASRGADIRLESRAGTVEQPSKNGKRSLNSRGPTSSVQERDERRRAPSNMTRRTAGPEKARRSPAKRSDPLAALRGGTRGLPFAVPPG